MKQILNGSNQKWGVNDMREILFKAKRVDSGEWVEGYIYKTQYVCLIFPLITNGSYDGTKKVIKFINPCFLVDPKTLCQDTGLVDTNGKKIWENDIVTFEDTGEDGYEYKEGFDFKNRAKVVFGKGRWELSDFLSDNSYILENMNNHEELFSLWDYVEVTGNIFDNAEVGCE